MSVQYKVYKPAKILNIHKHVDPWFWNKYSAHPYLGCEHGYEYCYNREKKYCPYDGPEDYSSIFTIKENAAEKLRAELFNKRRTHFRNKRTRKAFKTRPPPTLWYQDAIEGCHNR